MRDQLSAAAGRDVSRETCKRLSLYVDSLLQENDRQNLIAKSTADEVWRRHILDSAQLLRFAPDGGSQFADVGAGAGLPGLVLAILTEAPTTLIEPRRLRAEFLRSCAERLGLTRVTVAQSKAERVVGEFDVITARAVASLPKLLEITHHLSHPGTRWVLPKGRSGAKELAEAQRAWQGRFWTEPSLTDEESVILVAEGVKPRGGTR